MHSDLDLQQAPIRSFQLGDAVRVAQLMTESVDGHWVYRPEHFLRPARPQHVRLVSERGGEVVATAALSPFGVATPDAFRLDLAGDPAAYAALYLALLARLPAGFARLLGVVREDRQAVMAFFTAAGFRNAWQSWGAHLQLSHFAPKHFAALEERLFLAGYEHGHLSPNASEVDWEALHHLFEQGARDAPRNPTTNPEPLTLQQLREVAQREEVVFVTRLRGEIVASARFTPRGRRLESEHTVVHPAHRSRGLATSLKAHALTWAQAQGFTEAGTGGTVLNLPMLRVNTRLGYVPEEMWVTWEQPLPH